MLRLGGLALNLLYDYTMNSPDGNESCEEGNEKIQANHLRLKSIKGTLENYGGIFSKLSQMLSYSDHSTSAVYDECQPFSRDKTHEWFMAYLDGDGSKQPYAVDRKIYKSGSVGQVYKAYYNDETIVVKVLYRGLPESTKQDIGALEMLSTFMFGFVDLKNGLNDIKKKLSEELDYINEVKNTNKMYELWKDDEEIIVPRAFCEISDENIIATQFVEGVSLSTYLESATQEEKNRVGRIIVRFVFTNLYKWGIFYSDSHYGNIIITPHGKVAFIDFGCLNFVDESTRISFVRLHRSSKLGNREMMEKHITDLGIISETTTSQESRDYAIDFFNIQYTPWTSVEPFQFNDEWFKTVDRKNPKLMKEWNLPDGLIYFNKIPHGLTLMLCNMKCEDRFATNVFEDIL